jgi:hypothetical protein
MPYAACPQCHAEGKLPVAHYSLDPKTDIIEWSNKQRANFPSWPKEWLPPVVCFEHFVQIVETLGGKLHVQ